MRVLTVAACLFLLAGQISAQCPADIPWELVSGRCMVCGLDQREFLDANAYCQEHGGTVGPILDQAQQDFAETCSSDVTVGLTVEVWTGLRARAIGGAPGKYWHSGPPYQAVTGITLEETTATSGCYSISDNDEWTLVNENCEALKLFVCTRAPAMCNPIQPPSNTQVSYAPPTNPNYVDTVATYSCAVGYVVSGDSTTRTCLSDGMWSPVEPICAPVDCGPLVAPPQGMVAAAATTYNSVATYSCARGFAIAGASPTRTCLANHTWSGTDLKCTAVDCGALPAPTNGAVTAQSTVFGSVSIYSCDNGYEVDGGKERTCLSSGFWVPEAPTCVLEDSDTLAIALGTTLGGLALLGIIATLVLLCRRSPFPPRAPVPYSRPAVPRPMRVAPQRFA